MTIIYENVRIALIEGVILLSNVNDLEFLEFLDRVTNEKERQERYSRQVTEELFVIVKKLFIQEWQKNKKVNSIVLEFRINDDSDKKQIFNFGKHYEDIDYDYLKQLCNGVFVKTDKTLYNAEKSMEDHGVTFTLDIKKLYDEHKSDASNNKKKIR